MQTKHDKVQKKKNPQKNISGSGKPFNSNLIGIGKISRRKKQFSKPSGKNNMSIRREGSDSEKMHLSQREMSILSH